MLLSWNLPILRLVLFMENIMFYIKCLNKKTTWTQISTQRQKFQTKSKVGYFLCSLCQYVWALVATLSLDSALGQFRNKLGIKKWEKFQIWPNLKLADRLLALNCHYQRRFRPGWWNYPKPCEVFSSSMNSKRIFWITQLGRHHTKGHLMYLSGLEYTEYREQKEKHLYTHGDQQCGSSVDRSGHHFPHRTDRVSRPSPPTGDFYRRLPPQVPPPTPGHREHHPQHWQDHHAHQTLMGACSFKT